MNPSNLSAFESLKQISGSLLVQGSHPYFTHLKFLKSLKIVGSLDAIKHNYYSVNIVNTSLKTFGLQSLKKIMGSVYIVGNRNLCFTESVNWKKLYREKDNAVKIVHDNRDEKLCEEENLVCSKECSSDGCWDIGEHHCLSCAYFTLGERCVNSCRAHSRLMKVLLKNVHLVTNNVKKDVFVHVQICAFNVL